MKLHSAIFASIATLLLGVTVLMAQNAQPQGQGRPGGQMGQAGGQRGPQGPPSTMDLATAKRMVAAAEALAMSLNDHIDVSVFDSNGDLVLNERMDGIDHTPTVTSQAKARTALVFGIPSGDIADAVRAKKPISVTISPLPMNASGDLNLNFRGGLPVFRDGKLIGAIGVGGSASDQDEKYSKAGVDAVTQKQ